MGEILVLGDSLAFGRPKHGVCRDLTWPYLMSQELNCKLQFRAHGGASVIDVMKESRILNDYWFGGLNARKFDAVFIQAGIVDCCPRLVPRRLRRYVKKMPGFTRLERSPLAYNLIGRSWTSKTSFYHAVSDLVRILSGMAKTTFFVKIASPANHLVKNVGDFTEVVDSYNELIRKVVGREFLVDWQVEASDKIHILADGHHLTALGHQRVADACVDKYQSWLLR